MDANKKVSVRFHSNIGIGNGNVVILEIEGVQCLLK